MDGQRRLEKDPATAEIFSAFFDKLMQYRNVRRASRETNLEYGCDRALRSWQMMIKNEVYSGELRGAKEFCEPYLSRTDWESLQKPDQMVKSARKDRVYLFAGLLRCPVCGNTLKANYKTYPADRSREFYSYRCNNKPLQRCTYYRAISERKLEKYLVENVVGEFMRYSTETALQDKEQKKNAKKKTDVKKLQEQLRRLNVIYLGGNMSDAEYGEQASALRKAIDEAEQAFMNGNAPTRTADLDRLRAMLSNGLNAVYYGLSRIEKQQFWRGIIKEIRFKDNQVSRILFKV